MKATKLELQQSLNRVNADLVHALEQLSEARQTIKDMEARRNGADAACETHNRRLETENAFLRARLNEADHRARKLIRSANIQRNTQTSERRLALEAAKAKAMATGSVVKV